MSIPIRVLTVEDSEDDALLLLREFRRGGYEPIYRRVETREDLENALTTQTWDIVVSDYTMPKLTGLMALEIVQNQKLDLPFIIVSGNVGEDIAVEAMKAGAHDYLMKDNLKRLIPAVERELRETEVRWARKRAEQAVFHLTYHDALTSLLNRHEFERRISLALESAHTQHKQHALCYFDLDQFKVINDTCGHLAGDELLKQLANTIQKNLDEAEIFARLGGDEFGLLFENHTMAEAQQVTQALQNIIKKFRFAWDNEIFEIGASFGLVCIDKNSSSLAKIMSSADIACFAAKDLGRNRVYVHDEEDSALSKRYSEMQMVSRITRALKADRFCLYRQSIVPISQNNSNHVNHCEILLRMIDEDGSIIQPIDFMGAAERYNLMPTIDRWVINQVFEKKNQAKAQNNDNKDLHCAINLSGASISDHTFLDYIKTKSTEHKITAKSICFEITETVAIENLTAASHFIKELRKLGFQFALDDFGSGLSSFSYLKNLPVDYLKIDGSFVKDMHKDKIDYTMVESINKIGQVMGIKTIAEFVENDEILDKLKTIGVDFAQGYGIDKPHPINEEKLEEKFEEKQS